MAKTNQKKILIVVFLLIVVATLAIGSGCSALDPCVSQRNDCIDRCPTVVLVKQICQEKCNYQYDRCRANR
jgi:Na+-transporting NADH:ubiquinone oxidoreductase subunit NqrC